MQEQKNNNLKTEISKTANIEKHIAINCEFYKTQNYYVHSFYKPITRLLNINDSNMETK